MRRNSDERDLDEIVQLYKKLRCKMKKKWNRVLPFQELISDRWELAEFLKAKKDTSVYNNSYIYGDVRIGRNTWIGPYTILDGSGGKLTIGDYVSISAGVHVYTHNVVKSMLSGGKIPYERKRVRIGNNTYVGPYAIITMKSSIGNECVIGAHSFVNSKIPNNSIVVGIPGKIIGKTVIKKGKVELVYFDKKH
jgi:acetyltransferase-like isoleucine patch superfamily enzyme